MKVPFELCVLDCGCRAGTVEIHGEIYLSVLAVRDSSPVSLDRVIAGVIQLSFRRAKSAHPFGVHFNVRTGGCSFFRIGKV